jgi:hypothetical protein
MTKLSNIAVRAFTVLSFTFAIIVLWSASVSAAEYRKTGRCYTVEVLVTAKDGTAQHIARKTVCEYTAAERRDAAKARTGR